MKMSFLLGWTLLLLFGGNAAEALGKARNNDSGERQTTSRKVDSTNQNTLKTNVMLFDITTARTVNTKPHLASLNIETSTHRVLTSDIGATTTIRKLKEKNRKLNEKNGNLKVKNGKKKRNRLTVGELPSSGSDRKDNTPALKENRLTVGELSSSESAHKENTPNSVNGKTGSIRKGQNLSFKDERVEKSRDPANLSDLANQRLVSTTLSLREFRRRNGIGRNGVTRSPACTVQNSTLRGNRVITNCSSDTVSTGEERVFPLITVKYVTQAFPFIVNVVSIMFHCRRQGKTNVPMYVIAMNVTELISVLLGFSWGMIHKSPLAGVRSDEDGLITANLMHYIDGWVKQGSYIIHVLMTIERFQVVKYPMHYNLLWNVTKGKFLLLAALTFFLSSHIAGVTTSALLKDRYNRTLFYEWNLVSGVVFMLLPVTAIVILNSSTSIVFYLENSRIKNSCEGATLKQVLKREKKLITRLAITTTILIVTSAPLSLWELFLKPKDRPDAVRKYIGEGFSALSYFGNGVAFIVLMALSVADKDGGCKLCCMSAEPSSTTLDRAATQCVKESTMSQTA